MLGLFLAVVYAAWTFFTGSDVLRANWGPIYYNTFGFLHQWYIWTTVIMAVIGIIIFLIALFMGTAAGAQSGPWGAALGFFGVGFISILAFAFFIVGRGCLIVGSLLLSQALISGPPEPTWDITKLVIGIILMIVGLAIRTSGSSSSSRND